MPPHNYIVIATRDCASDGYWSRRGSDPSYDEVR